MTYMNHENKQNSNTFPKWEKAWMEKLSEVDKHIVNYMQDADEQSSEMLDKLTRHISQWFEEQPKSDELKAEWEKMKADGSLLRSKVENRMTHLVEDGKLKLKQLTQASGKH